MVTYTPDDVGSDTTSHYTDTMNNTNTEEDLAATIESMRTRMAEMERELQSTRPVQRTSPPRNESTSPATDPLKRPRPKIGDIELYNNTDRSLYPQFISKLRAKLNIDKDAIGNAYDRTWYIFSRLTGSAAAQVLPWMDHYAGDMNTVTEQTLRSLLDHLDFTFKDRNLRERAVRALGNLKQANKPFSTLFNEFNRLLMEAGGHDWDSEVKRSYLDNALNHELNDRLVTVEKKENFSEYVVQLQLIADRMEKNANQPRGLRHNDTNHRVNRPNPPNPNTNPVISMSPVAVPQSDQMDWAPTISRHRSRQTAKWVSNEEINARKEQKLCIRCGGSGHFISKCPYDAPRRTNISRTQVAPKLEDSEESIMETQLGKEQLL